MSDVGRGDRLVRSHTQLPVGAYFDDALFEREIETLFRGGPGYVGHERMVPEPGDYCVLPAEDDGRMLVRNERGTVELLSNVCRHRQALMLDGRGNARNLVCPLHRWTYDLSGRLLGAPRFDEQPCLDLPSTALQSWNGLLFRGPRDVVADLAGLGARPEFDFSDHLLDHVEIHECDYNWKTFIEVYLEDYHVVPFHPGLGQFVSCDNLEWQFGERYSLQTVGAWKELRKPGTPAYRRWQEELLRFSGGQAPQCGAVWLTCYPNVMLEWYPHVLIISTLVPRSPQKTTNIIEFYYPQEIALFERDLVEAERAAYMETALEDDEIAQRMDAGRRVLLARGENDAGPYQSPLEDGMQHFHEFLRAQLGPIG